MIQNLIQKTFTVDAAHRLSQHPGKCKNIHGHHYEIGVTFRRIDGLLNSDEMVMDFSKLQPIREWLDLFWDHNILLNMADPLDTLLETFTDRNGMKLPYLFSGDPTAENMARVLFEVIETLFPLPEMRLISVEVWETPTSKAIYGRQR